MRTFYTENENMRKEEHLHRSSDDDPFPELVTRLSSPAEADNILVRDDGSRGIPDDQRLIES